MKRLAIALALFVAAFGAQASVATYEDNFDTSSKDGYLALSLLKIYSSSTFAVAAGDVVSVDFFYSTPSLLGGFVALVKPGLNIQTLDWVGSTTNWSKYGKSNPGVSDTTSKSFSESFDGLVAGSYTLKIWAPVALRLDDVKVTVTSVPEPETYAMLLAGLGIMGALARRRRNVG